MRYQYRVYPTPGQADALAQVFGCARVVFNDFIRAKKTAYEAGVPLSDSEAQTLVVTTAKRTPERAWLADVSSVALVQACQDARSAFKNWFDSITGRRKGRKLGPPRFRSRKDHRQSIRLTRNGFSVRGNGKLYVAKVGELTVHWSRALASDPSSVTIIKDAAGRYFASFVVQADQEQMPETDSTVGVDLGLTTFAVLSDGKTIASPRFLRQAERRLRKAHQALSRKQKGSNNKTKARLRVAKAHVQVADTRRDWAHKHSTQIIRDNQAVFVEDLNVRGLGRTRLAKSVHDAGWGMFLTMLEEKASRYGRGFVRVGRFFPSSQLCHACGVHDGLKPLSVREWTCQGCGTVLDRDLNAAKNIHAEGLSEWLNACGGAVSLSA